ncbi:hypothetical protein MMC24_005821 [Lignoscripta atroalba]|nr:hypothetical protein [Lignoscripta atroalba]
MSFMLTVPKEYGFVLLTAALTPFVATYHVYLVTVARKAAKVPYPNAYAPASEADPAVSPPKYLFNCAQRAHANYLENQPQVLISLLIAGLKYPVLSAGLGVAWCVGRLMYAWGYSRKGKDGKGVEGGKGRLIGTWSSIPAVALMVMALVSAAGFLMG